MFRHLLSIKILLVFLAVSLLSCEQNERESTQRLVFEVQAGEGMKDFDTNYLASQRKYLIEAPSAAFILPDSNSTELDPSLTPTRLVITFDQPGSIVPSMLRALGYKVTTRFEFKESLITVNHTNVADSLFVVTPGDTIDTFPDTLYIAVRGEGLISGGENIFENITGFFFEQSTYTIVNESVTNISCRYELTVEY